MNRLLKYASEAEYLAAKPSLLIPYVATYPSSTSGKSVIVYANADGTNTSEVIATAQLTTLITAMQKELDEVTLLNDALMQDVQQLTMLRERGFDGIPTLFGQPMILFGAGTPQESIKPTNWKNFDPMTGEGYNWNGTPSAEGQVYINTTADSNGRYTAVRSGYNLVWKNF